MKRTYEAVQFKIRMEVVPSGRKARRGPVDDDANAQAGLDGILILILDG